MPIASITATPVSAPTIRPCAWSRGTAMGLTRTVVELATDDGLVGLGECEGSAAAMVLNGQFGRKLVGFSADSIAPIARLCRVDFADYGSLADQTLVKVYAAIEMAMWDLIGKATGMPVFSLLGGAARPRAQFSAYGHSIHGAWEGIDERRVPELMAERAKRSIASTGATQYEFKVGRFSLTTDIDTVIAVRNALGPQISIGLDANQVLKLEDARRLLRGAGNASPDWFEEPTASFVDMSRLHREFQISLSTHCVDGEKLACFLEIRGVVRDLHLQGGLSGARRAAAAIRALGKSFWQRSSLELGISWAAMVHLGIACLDVDAPSQSLIDWVEDDLIASDPWLLKDGGVAPPNRPGLGVELDCSALQRYAELFREKGEMTYFDQQ